MADARSGADLAAAEALLEDDLEVLYEEAPCGYISTLPDGTILKVNRTFERWTSLPRDELLGRRRFQDLLTPGGRIYHETHYRPLLEMQEAVREIALEIVCADGSRLPVLVNSVLRRDDLGRAQVVRTTLFNATDRRSYERELVRARERAEQLGRRSAMVAETSRVLVLHRSVARRAKALLKLLVEDLAEGASVQLAAADEPCERAGRSDDPRLLEVLAEAVREGTIRIERETEDGPPRTVAMPMTVEGQPVGVLALALAQSAAHTYGEDLLPLLEELADRAAVAIENAQLYERERAVGLTLQRAMLEGRIPVDARCEIGTHYTAAIETLEVGGDWYDGFVVEPGRIVVVVGDVVGKGLDAATTMGQLRSALRALAITGAGPAAVLTSLDAYAEHSELARGATVALAELDLESGMLRFACAGHPPPIVLPAGGEPELVWDGRSVPLGTYGEFVRPEATVRLAPGTRVLLYSDGIVERRDRPIDLGIDRLMAAFARRRSEAVTTVGSSLAEELLPERHGADDVCTLVLEYRG